MSSTTLIRPLRSGEERAVLELHHRAVHALASGSYPPEVIDAWAPPITNDMLRAFRENADDEIRIVAEINGQVVGFGALVIASTELRACYVAPEVARQGVGTALVRVIERLAREHGLDRLELVASVNAESFYEALGYESLERTHHTLKSGQRMAAVHMRKRLT